MTSPLADRTAIVTGAGRGIGKAIALGLAREGARVALAARTLSELESLAREIERLGSRAIPVATDVSRERDVARLAERTLAEFGKIDILVNNAGIGAFARISELSPEDFDAMWGTNVRGAFLCTRAVLPSMTAHRLGDIINIASLAGRNAFIGGGGYAATKWALIGLARCLMLEVREQNIRVITLCPGSVDTSFNHSGPKNTSAIPKSEDIARVVLDTLLMPRSVMVSEVDIRPTNPKG